MNTHHLGNKFGAGANHALRLVLVMTLGTIFVGCRKTVTAVPQHFVQIEALLPLHPAYAQAALHDRTAAEIVQSAETIATPQPIPAKPLPASFSAGVLIPPSMAREREQRIAVDSRRYLALLEDSLTRRNGEILEREERAGKKQIAVEIEAERLKHEQTLREQYAHERADIERKRLTFEFRREALRSQERVYNGMMKADAVLQLNQVNGNITAFNNKLKQIEIAVADIPGTAASELISLVNQREAELKSRLQNRRNRLKQEVEDRKDREQLRLDSESESIPELTASVLPTSAPSDKPLPPLDAASSAALAAVKPNLRAALTQAQAEQKPSREKFLAVLRADTQKAVEQIALREGWTLVPPGTLNASDYTAHAADALKDQWK